MSNTSLKETFNSKRKNINKILGTAFQPRLSIKISNKHFYVQLINDFKGHTIASSSTLTLFFTKNNTKNYSFLVGEDLGKKAVFLSIKYIFIDSLYLSYRGKIKDCLKAIQNYGIQFKF